MSRRAPPQRKRERERDRDDGRKEKEARRERSRSRSRSRDRSDRDKERDKERVREADVKRDRDRDTERQRDRDRERDRERDRDRDRRKDRAHDDDKDRKDRDRTREKDKKASDQGSSVPPPPPPPPPPVPYPGSVHSQTAPVPDPEDDRGSEEAFYIIEMAEQLHAEATQWKSQLEQAALAPSSWILSDPSLVIPLELAGADLFMQVQSLRGPEKSSIIGEAAAVDQEESVDDINALLEQVAGTGEVKVISRSPSPPPMEADEGDDVVKPSGGEEDAEAGGLGDDFDLYGDLSMAVAMDDEEDEEEADSTAASAVPTPSAQETADQQASDHSSAAVAKAIDVHAMSVLDALEKMKHFKRTLSTVTTLSKVVFQWSCIFVCWHETNDILWMLGLAFVASSIDESSGARAGHGLVQGLGPMEEDLPNHEHIAYIYH